MSGALHSSNWFRIAALRPRLGGHVQIHRHLYRSAVWYVVEDRVAAKYHRFNPSAYRIISALDGKRSMQDIWNALALDLREDSPSQDEIVNLLGQLNAADLIVTEASVDVAELFERHHKQGRQKRLGRFANPLSLRFPPWDPDRFLGAWCRAVGGVPAIVWVALWLAVVLPAFAQVPVHWRELTENFSERLLAAHNLAIMVIAFVVLKGLHELGHGWSIKVRGGEVHEMGLMLLLFYPVPYVDASSASAFTRKSGRMHVGAAGMLVEVWVAALAFFAWMLLEPGFLRSLCYDMLVIGSVTTVVFNANPLLRYDGYYILCDLIEIPNLGNRANAYWIYLMRRFVFGIGSTRPPSSSPAERRWFIAYAPTALVYRLLVTITIAWFVGQQYFFIGVLLGAWSIGAGLVWPLGKGLVKLWNDPQASSRALRVWSAVASVPVLAGVLLFAVPLPHHTRAKAVLSLPDNAMLRAGADGFVRKVLAAPGKAVVPGQLIVHTDAAELQADFRVQLAKVAEAQARRDAAWNVQPAAAGRLEEELQRENAALAQLQADTENLDIRAGSAGTLLIDQAGDLPGRHLRKGEPIGYLVGSERPIVKVIVAQQHADWVRSATRRISVRLPQDFSHELEGRLLREVPRAGKDLPSATLGQSGGGDLTVDPRDEKGTTAIETLFAFEVELPALAQAPGLRYLGSRAYVGFEHPSEPLGWRLWREARRQLLSHFQV
ncbi:MAG: PqqD family peptide modification chaperone [Microbacteriaceae bacterium]|nr:PqqD family peptide modification chaperone [Burkholderiaceae bacterium]